MGIGRKGFKLTILGFTLIELLAVVVILGLLIIAVVPNLLETYKQVKEREKEVFVARMSDAARVYAENNKNDIDSLEIINGVAYVTLRDLVDEGLLNTPIIDPEDNKEVPLTTLIKITRTANNKFEIVYDFSYPPTIEIIGSQTVNITVGTAYVDAGATAFSSVDGNITSLIQRTDNVNINVVGAYTVTYTVTDSKGGRAVATRSVNVVPNNSFVFNTTMAIQTWVVPSAGTYRIEVWGAEGGWRLGLHPHGGRGARMRGDFLLSAGTTLNIIVGQQGRSSSNPNLATGVGGGGGSFVYTGIRGGSGLLIAAGGGGGQGGAFVAPGTDASISTSSNLAMNWGGGGCGGHKAIGHGGRAGYIMVLDEFSSSGAGGFGWLSDGDNGGRVNPAPAQGAVFPNGGFASTGANGGFGGGGGGNDSSGGGGGGYTGGGGGNTCLYEALIDEVICGAGGGGGSFNAGTNQSNNAGAKTGNGLITITLLP